MKKSKKIILIGTIEMGELTVAEDRKKENPNSYSLIPTEGLGQNILEAANQSLKKKMHEQIVGQVETIGNRAAQIQTNIEQMQKQHDHLWSQMEAIKNNQFIITNSRIVFSDADLNQDAAVRFPYKSY